ncbi:MAG: sodium:panthothenate symporter [Lentisphaerae bacterium]|nr:sodium:panthothenate symporter [Lentisphaerota bacterium]
MNWYNWLIVILPFAGVLYMAFYVRKYIRSVPDFLAGGRVCGRYLLSVGTMEAGLSVIALIAYVEVHYRTGFSTGFWSNIMGPIGLVLSLTGFVAYRLRETKALSMGQLLEMRYSRSFRLFCAFLRTSVEMLANTILPAISARFFIYLLGIPHYIDICGFRVQSLALVIALVLILAATILLAGGSLSLLITDTVQGLMTYPIIFIFTLFILLNFSWWDEIVPVMADRVPGESFINPYDIQSLRDFNLFAVFATLFASILNRGNWFGGGASSAARTAHEQKMAGILGAWRNGFNPLFYLLLAAMILTVMNHVNYAPKAKVIRSEMCSRIAGEIIPDRNMRQLVIEKTSAIPEQRHIIGKDKPLSEKRNLDTVYLKTVHDSLGKTPEGNAKFQEFRTLYNQLRLPFVIRHVLPGALTGIFILLMLMLMVSSDDSHIFSAAMSIVQDIILPFRKTPMSPQTHIRLVKCLTVFICVFYFFGALYMTQLDYINLYVTVVVSIWSGGAGAVILGGLYTRFGTTAGAYASILTGAVVSGGGMLVQRNWADTVYPFLDRMGMIPGLSKLLAALSSPFEPWILWRMSAVKFPINSTEIMFIAMILSIAMYCLVSILTCRRPFNLERMLHRGKYAVDGEVKHFEKLTWRNLFRKIIGITPDYTFGDKCIAWGTFIWSFGIGFGVYFLATVIWNAFYRWPTHWWGIRLFILSIVIACVIAAISMVWFMIGGIIDLRRMFRDLAARTQINELDNGMVDGNVSLADKKDFEQLDHEKSTKNGTDEKAVDNSK